MHRTTTLKLPSFAFFYNGGEGGRVAAPTVRDVMSAYFELKAVDTAQGLTTNP